MLNVVRLPCRRTPPGQGYLATRITQRSRVSLVEGEDANPNTQPFFSSLIVTGALPGDGYTAVASLCTTMSPSLRTSLRLQVAGKLLLT